MTDTLTLAALNTIATALERMAPPPVPPVRLNSASAFVWLGASLRLQPVAHVNRVDLDLLKAVDHARDGLLENTRRFARGLPANNALLWGARGMGKSSLVKAVHHTVAAESGGALRLVEIHREDIATLPDLMALVRAEPESRMIVFCDDLSFDGDDTSYKSLKGALDGGIEGRPENMLFYATSNRRHLMARSMIENESATAINPSEAVQEKVSLSDRFGLWLGFHQCSQEEYLAMIEAYANAFHLPIDPAMRDARALEWSVTRGSRSGRVAWQFIRDLAGALETRLVRSSD